MKADVWMGYLLQIHDDFTVVQSPFVLNDARVFGADSDATTLAVAALLHRTVDELVTSVSIPDGFDARSISQATGIQSHNLDDGSTAPWDLLLSDEATVVLARHGAEVTLADLEISVDVDEGFHEAINEAWRTELSSGHVSQGAYVSQAQYQEAALPRLSLVGQTAEGAILWPPRFSHLVAGVETSNQPLKREGTIQTWTTLSAAGAPSEFSLRAPLLGGISTVLLHLDDGPKGVFLVVDDEDVDFAMDGKMELVFRRLYAQEGVVRYGLKARSIAN